MNIPLKRDPKTDHLLTAENSALIMIDYQPGLIEGTHSISRKNLVNNATAMARNAGSREIQPGRTRSSTDAVLPSAVALTSTLPPESVDH